MTIEENLRVWNVLKDNSKQHTLLPALHFQKNGGGHACKPAAAPPLPLPALLVFLTHALLLLFLGLLAVLLALE